jgi:Protein of unknown function (DUF1573)
MWRWLLLVVVVIALSAAGAVLTQYIPSPEEAPAAFPAPTNEEKGPPPLATVEGGDLTHRFGVMAQDDEGAREWVIKNAGEGDLKLTQGEHTCSCTIASLKGTETAVLKPGESTPVKLKWETRKNDGVYEKSSSINTNDPQRPVIKFAVSGTVRPPIVRMPPDDTLDFHSILNDKPITRPIMVYSPNRPDLKIKSVTSRRPDLVSVKERPATEKEEAELKVKGAHKIDVTVTPGNNLGTFLAEVLVETDHPKKKELVIPLTGKIVGPISASPEGVRLSSILGSRGGRGIVMLTVHDQEQTTFDVIDKPEKLKVTVTPLEAPNAAKGQSAPVKQYTMTVEVPPGTSPGGILGNITLKTSHPKAAQIKLPVDIIVLGQR